MGGRQMYALNTLPTLIVRHANVLYDGIAQEYQDGQGNQGKGQ